MKKATKLIAPALGAGLVFGAIGVSASETVTVKPGDTYWGLAQKYEDVSIVDLVEANEYDPYSIPTGVEITIPTNEENSSEEHLVKHVIQPGNTLSEIADVYEHVTVEALMKLNPDQNHPR